MPQYVTRIDVSPVAWQFLQNLRMDDLPSELVQNELDAGSLVTRLTFGKDQFTCEGNGECIDADGWRRLSYFLGAGNAAPRKRSKTGVKNHGLKTCFMLGDHIRILSDGKRVEQTLYCNGETKDPCPGTFEWPTTDDSAPRAGCRIEIPYRRKRLLTKVGESFEFAPVEDQELDALFERLVKDAPRRFLGVIRPGFRVSYTLVVTHWRLGTVTFRFRSRRISQKPKELHFARSCTATTTDSIAVESRDERAVVFPLRLSRQELSEVPDFYALGRGACGEISWKVDARGQPIPDLGVCRYPLGYPEDIHAGRTGLGVFYSAPFKSDTFRHGLGNQAGDLNAKLIEHCDLQLVALLRSHLMPRFGPGALSIICDVQEPDSSRALHVVGKLVGGGAIPIVMPGSRARKRISKAIAGYNGTRSTGDKEYTFVIPDGDRIAELLATGNLTGFPTVDPSTPATVISLLLSRDCVGWGEAYVSFDWQDVVNRLLQCENDWFTSPTNSQLTAELSSLNIVRAYLDVLKSLEDGPHNAEWSANRTELVSRLSLPDTNGDLQPLALLYRAPQVPFALPGIKASAIIHPDLAKHPLLSRAPWRREKLDFASYLSDLNLEERLEHRMPFWDWLRSEPSAISSKLWSRLKQLPIWPDKSGRQVKFIELCVPADRQLGRAMAGVLSAPHAQTARVASAVAKIGSIRSTPTFSEIDAWYSTNLGTLPKDGLSAAERDRFRQIEATLVRLFQKKATRKHLKRLVPALVAMSQAGSLRPPATLHALTMAIRRLQLLPSDLAESRDERLSALAPFSSVLLGPALVRAMKSDATNVVAFEPRILAYAELKQNGCHDLENVEATPIVPFADTLVAPSSLAFSGKEDYWGDWKQRLGSRRLSAKLHEAYRQIGVLSAKPTMARSREFFNWLSRQPQDVLSRHLSCVLRHFLNEGSVLSWWNTHPDPCLPVQQGGIPKLISVSDAKHARQPAYIPDFPELARLIASNPTSRIRVLYATHPAVPKPLDDLFRHHGFQSLRKAAGDPSVSTSVELRDITEACRRILDALHSQTFRKNLHRYLSSLDLDHAFLRENWEERVRAAIRVRVAQDLQLTYVIAGEAYPLSADVAFDVAARALWITAHDEPEVQLCHAIAECLFVAGAPRYTRAAVTELLFSAEEEPFSLEPSVSMDSEEAEDDESLELEETFETHTNPLLPSVPRPVPMSRIPGERRVNGSRVPSLRPSLRPQVEIESVQLQELKVSQYAWHCQICLGELTALDLAPAGSYGEHPINRQGMMQAHHADQWHSGGARHGGNLILLCRRHHGLVGDSFTRDAITSALRDSFARKTLKFPIGDMESTSVGGVTITIAPPDLESPVTLFFTEEHRELWLWYATSGGAETKEKTPQDT